jgi:hypothetical protein
MKEMADLSNVDERLRKLEKENRWLKRCGAAALLLFATFLVMGQSPGKRTIQAQSFELRDASGELRASLGFVEHEPVLRFFRDDPSVDSGDVEIGLSPNKTPFLDMFVQNSISGVNLTAGIHGPSIDLIGRDGRVRAEVNLSNIILADANGKIIWAAP